MAEVTFVFLCSVFIPNFHFLKLSYHTFQDPNFSDVSVDPTSRIRTADTSATFTADN
jgi:hypothetical protein